MIGVLGGTFDPIHFGHLRPALDCLQALGLDEVRFVPLKVAVHRPQPMAAAGVRLAMVQAAVAGVSGLVADGRELDRAGPSYSYDTLASLRQELGPRVPICLLVGADAFNGFLTWHRPAEILDLAHLVVMQRPDAPEPSDQVLRRWLSDLGCAGPQELRRRPARAHLAPAGDPDGYLIQPHSYTDARRTEPTLPAPGLGAGDGLGRGSLSGLYGQGRSRLLDPGCVAPGPT